MVKAADEEPAVASGTLEAVHGRLGHLVEVLHAAVGEVDALDVRPEDVDGVEVRRVGWQVDRVEPSAVAMEEAPHDAALVGAEVVPDEEDPLGVEVVAEVAKDGKESGSVVGAGSDLEVEPCPAAVEAVGEEAAAGELLPAKGLGQDGRLAPRGPGASDGGGFREARFVEKDDPGPKSAGFFFIDGQTSRTQRRIRRSFRSLARRVGRWSDQPRVSRRTRHTWPGW